MNNSNKLIKIDSIVNSCITYDQLLTCFSFTKFFPDDISSQIKVTGIIQKKAYSMRNIDIKEQRKYKILKKYLLLGK